MKKYLVGLFVLGLMVSFPFTTKAFTLDDLMSQILNLKQEVASLRSQIMAQTRATTIPATSLPTTKVIAPSTITTTPTTNTIIKPSVPVPSKITTSSATSITSTTATLNGSVIGFMNTSSTTQKTYFIYGTSSTNLNNMSSQGGPVNGSFSKLILNLKPDTTYYFKAVANMGSGNIQYGNIVSFKTSKAIPQISTTPALIENENSYCLPTTAPWIKVLSPNGGETFTAGQQITVRWTSCNISTNNDKVIIILQYFNVNGGNITSSELVIFTVNDGQEMVTLPSVLPTVLGAAWGTNFKILVGMIDNKMLRDYSDNLFIINFETTEGTNLPAGCNSSVGYSSTTGVSCGCNGTIYSTYNGQPCPVTTTPVSPTSSNVIKPITSSILKTNPSATLKFSPLGKTLRKGSRGEDVKTLQKIIKALGFNPGSIDGVWGSKLETAVRKLQKANGLKVDGIVGRDTKPLLENLYNNTSKTLVAGGGTGATGGSGVGIGLGDKDDGDGGSGGGSNSNTTGITTGDDVSTTITSGTDSEGKFKIVRFLLKSSAAFNNTNNYYMSESDDTSFFVVPQNATGKIIVEAVGGGGSGGVGGKWAKNTDGSYGAGGGSGGSSGKVQKKEFFLDKEKKLFINIGRGGDMWYWSMLLGPRYVNTPYDGGRSRVYTLNNSGVEENLVYAEGGIKGIYGGDSSKDGVGLGASGVDGSGNGGNGGSETGGGGGGGRGLSNTHGGNGSVGDTIALYDGGAGGIGSGGGWATLVCQNAKGGNGGKGGNNDTNGFDATSGVCGGGGGGGGGAGSGLSGLNNLFLGIPGDSGSYGLYGGDGFYGGHGAVAIKYYYN